MPNNNKIWIFGDSWADKSYNNANIESWPIMLDKKYSVKNFAVAGSGPEYSLSVLYDMVKKTDTSELSETSVFFIASHALRVNMSFVEPRNQVLLKFATYNVTDPRLDNYTINKLNKNISTDKQKFLKKFFKYYFLNFDRNFTLMKTIGALMLIRHKFKKILFVSSFDDIPNNIAEIDNFSFFSRSSLSELLVTTYPYDQDMTSNHLENSQHPVFYEQLENWLLYDSKIDFEAIKKAV